MGEPAPAMLQNGAASPYPGVDGREGDAEEAGDFSTVEFASLSLRHSRGGRSSVCGVCLARPGA